MARLAGAAGSRALLERQLICAHYQLEVLSRLEFRVLVYLIEQPHEPLQVDARRDAHLATELPCDALGETLQHSIVDLADDALGHLGRVEVANASTHLHHLLQVEGLQPNLRRA